jgi:hypothetical protein
VFFYTFTQILVGGQFTMQAQQSDLLRSRNMCKTSKIRQSLTFTPITQLIKLIAVSFVLCGLVACTDEPPKGSTSSSSSSSSGKSSSSSSSSSSGKSSSSSSSSSSNGGGAICPAIYKPVCSVVPQNIQCKKAPCPTGVYQTFSNLCASDAAKAKFISNGECGDLEGKPYPDEKPTACTKEYAPVCGTAVNRAPCNTIPCPAIVYKTYSNPCEARAAESQQTKPGSCGGLEGTRVKPVTGGACPAVYAPVCGKTTTNIVCITQPCPTHVYKTFGNSCEANYPLATIISNKECGTLQDQVAGGEPPVKLVNTLPAPVSSVRISNVQFKQDVLTLTLGYSGCGPQHFDFYIVNSFLKSLPVQVNYAFKAQQEEACDAAFSTEFSYDLLPLKQLYGTPHGEIVLPGIGSYVF